MKIFVADDIKAYLLVSGSNRFESLDFQKGMYLDSLEYYNIPEHIRNDIDTYLADDILKRRIFVIYMKRKYWKIDNNRQLQVCKYQ